MKIRASALVGLCLAVSAAAQDRPWQAWELSRPIELGGVARGQLVRVALPRELLRKLAPKLRDLRVLDDRQDEVPYVLDLVAEPSPREWRAATVTDTGTVRGAFSQAVLDTGEGDELHDTVELDIAEDDFLGRVEVAASSDAVTWRIVAEGQPIYRSAATGLRGSTRVRYPATRNRWLRVRLEGETPLHVEGARVSHRPEVDPELILLVDEAEPLAGQNRSSAWRLDAGGPTLASRVVVTTAEESFHRPVEVRSSDDGEDWRHAGEGQIYRFADGEPPVVRQRTHVDFPEVRARYYEVRIYDGDDEPLRAVRIQVLGLARYLVFRAEAGGSYRLIYGNPRADVPEYDLARTVRPARLRAAPAVLLGAEIRNAEYRSSAPWSERNAWVLWVALALAVAGLAWSAWRVMRTPREHSRGTGGSDRR